MAQQIGALTASLELQSANFINGLERASKATTRNTEAINRAMDRTATAVKGFAAALVFDKAIEGARKYLELADANKKMEAQLRLSTAQMGNQGIAMRDVEDIAKETRSEVSGISDLYAKFMPTSKELGRSQADNARATETFTKALKISGASTQEQQSAQLQMGQALSSTSVQWEELGQIMEASPRITRILTDSLGKTKSELKQMASEGKLTSKMLYDAFVDTKITAQIDSEFQELPATFDQAKTLMENSLMELVGAFDQGSGISDSIVDGMSHGSEAMDNIVAAAEEAGADIRANFEGLDNVFNPLGENASNVMEWIRRDANYTRETIGNLLRFIDKAHNAYAWADNLGTRAENGTKRVLNRMIDRSGGGQHFVETPLIERWHMGDDYDAGWQRSRVQSARNKVIRNIRTYGGKDYRNFSGKGLTDAQLSETARRVTADIRAGRTVDHGTGRTPPPTPPRNKGGHSAADKAEREAEKARREQERAVEKSRRDLEAFTADKNRADGEELDSRAALATVGHERFEFEQQALDQDRKNRMDQIDKDGPQGSKRYTEAQVAELKSIEERITANKKQALTYKESEFNAQEELKLKSGSLQNAEDIAQLQSSMAKTAKDRRAAELRLLDLQIEQEKLALDAILATRDATDAEKEVAKRRLAMLPQLRAAQGKQVEQQTMGPLAQYLDAIPKTADEINEALQNVEVDGLEGLQSGLLDCIKGAGNLGDAFTKMADTVVDGLLKIALQQLLVKPLGSLLFGGESSGGGGLLGGLIKGIAGLGGAAAGGSLASVGSSAGAIGSVGSNGLLNFSGFRANGGLTRPGRYVVGERGAELVDIGQNANVIPHHKLDAVRGNGGNNVNVTFGSITSNDPEAVKAMAVQAIIEMSPMLTQNAMNATMAKLQRPHM
ncbi:tape measure protein [Sphingomonas aerophila]|uniref:Tape measure domain-containing protein n=1 Tax=Sphingomonas aerophila TaxID=1344948 RepID=A0A7W9BET8_9SPHN|nr:tape measure protein [Sphingomonas aerophila]MBB5715846.1 tape measure domain-containing protein [Sphingomonas aerophila]